MKPISQDELKRRMLQCGGISPDDAENKAVMELMDRAERSEGALRDAFTMFVITQPPELYPADHWSNRASAILAGHAPATPQYTTEGEE